ncbi:Cytochrome c biogenesis protein CcsA [Planctomycetes bacterium Pan216]|uniref:Cytochrome c biogenesis protein CcsA n=1 Tax=Kolteria novifilia TaxID=2527975 RepID=A0A518B998_9BACT|nr:Cytochrome c biogenesis protein CcsA [Planctomycetes bacterium Pan216]
MRTRGFTAGLLALLLVTSAQAGQATPSEDFDWDTWRAIAVQSGGRHKPLDTHAREFITRLTGRSNFKPEAFAAISIADVKDWNGLSKALLAAAESGKPTAVARIANELSGDLRGKLAKADLDTEKLRAELKSLNSQLKTELDVVSYDQPTIQSLQQLRQFAIANRPEVAKMFAQRDKVEAELNDRDALRARLVHELNDLVGWQKLYDATAWKDVELDEATQALVQKTSVELSPRETGLLNRALVAAALPEVIAPYVPGETKFGPVVVEGRKYDPVELYMTLLLSWQGWDQPEQFGDLLGTSSSFEEVYWKPHKADAWDQTPLINARFEPMTPLLKPETLKAVSPRTIGENKAFVAKAREIEMKQRVNSDAKLGPLEEKVSGAHNGYASLVHQRIGNELHILPNQSTDSNDWQPIAVMFSSDTGLANEGYDTATIASLRKSFQDAREGLFGNNAAKFNDASRRFADGLQQLGEKSHIYPTEAEIARELTYNRSKPFRITWVLAFLASAVLAISLGVKSPYPYYVGMATLIASMASMVYGVYLRIMIAGRPPVTNLYETLLWAAFVLAVLAVSLSAIYKHRIIATAAAVTFCLSTLLAESIPIQFGASISPLEPVLRSNYWLIVHVLTIVASYGAFMLAWALGNIGLGFYLAGVDRPEDTKPMALFAYRAIQVGVLLLTIGTILGGVWAADSWGRFWGWDPKEVWALIALIGYLVVLHGRFIGLFKTFGMLAGSVLMFMLIVMSWYGVNFVLGAGLHAYAFGEGGVGYVSTAVGANLAYVGACYYAALRSKSARATQKTDAPEETDIADASGDNLEPSNAPA